MKQEHYVYGMAISNETLQTYATLMAYKIEMSFAENGQNNPAEYKKAARMIMFATLDNFKKFNFDIKPDEPQEHNFQKLFTRENNITLMDRFIAKAVKAFYRQKYLPQHPGCTLKTFLDRYTKSLTMQQTVWLAVRQAILDTNFDNIVKLYLMNKPFF